MTLYMLCKKTRISSTAEKQRVSYSYLSRSANSSCDSYYFIARNYKDWSLLPLEPIPTRF